MDGSNGLETRINSFALVSYLEGPLAALLDQIRHDFAPDSRAKAHLTILPPRPLASFGSPTAVAQALQQLQGRLQDFAPFNVELGDIEVFPETHVIYVSIKHGFEELERVHDALNGGCLSCKEPHSYHPHVTVVQELAPVDVLNAAQFARWRWSEFKHSRKVRVDRLTFVQNNQENYWTDLAMLDLGSPVPRHA
ncbi:MAG: 2'-5' RNA ligase family protein [Acidobacteriota bacterium]|nr:2'-5' RNA ligase family protein [Acidobacteriota bacterium]